MLILQGKDIYLAKLERKDCRVLFQNAEYDFLHPTEALNLGASDEGADAWFEEIQRLHGQNIRVGIFLNDGTVIGDVALQNISHVHRSADVGMGMAKLEHRGKGYGKQALSLLLQYGFCYLGLERISARTLDVNIGAQKALEHLGFHLEGTERQAIYFNGERHDRLLYAILKDEYSNPANEYMERKPEAQMILPTKTLTTQRLLLRPFVPEDAAGLYRNWASDTEATCYMGWDTYTSMEDADARMRYLQDQYARQSACEWAIVLRESGELIGSLGAYPSWDTAKSVEAGYIIGKRWWHQGLVPEAFSAAIRYLFTETEVLRIWAWHDSRNPNSGAVMRKCGMTCEGTMRQAGTTNAGICDMVIYSILRSDIVNATLI